MEEAVVPEGPAPGRRGGGGRHEAVGSNNYAPAAVSQQLSLRDGGQRVYTRDRDREWQPAVSVIAEEFRNSPDSSALSAATAAPDRPDRGTARRGAGRGPAGRAESGDAAAALVPSTARRVPRLRRDPPDGCRGSEAVKMPHWLSVVPDLAEASALAMVIIGPTRRGRHPRSGGIVCLTSPNHPTTSAMRCRSRRPACEDWQHGQGLRQPHQVVGVYGLGEVMVEAGRQGPGSVLGLAVAGQDDQQDATVEGCPQTAGHLVAVEQRQADVHHGRLGPAVQALARPPDRRRPV